MGLFNNDSGKPNVNNIYFERDNGIELINNIKTKKVIMKEKCIHDKRQKVKNVASSSFVEKVI